jgi:hypothetical protein
MGSKMRRDSDLGKREVEREHLTLFRDAYETATGESFPELHDSETPDFIGRDIAGRRVGIEITQLRFSPDEQVSRRIGLVSDDASDTFWLLLGLLHQKGQKLIKGWWPQCERKILVVMAVDSPLHRITPGIETDRPDGDGFDEVWLADLTQVEAFGGVDIFALVHPRLEGLFSTGDWGQNPFG